MRKKVGVYDILDTGSIVGNINEPIDFIIDETSDFIVRFIFINDSNQTAHSRRAEKFGKNGVQFIFTNYNNSLGIGNISPVRIGSFNKRELYLNFRINHLEGAGKQVSYTWLLGKEVSNG